MFKHDFEGNVKVNYIVEDELIMSLSANAIVSYRNGSSSRRHSS